jgi:hypothetical protein
MGVVRGLRSLRMQRVPKSKNIGLGKHLIQTIVTDYGLNCCISEKNAKNMSSGSYPRTKGFNFAATDGEAVHQLVNRPAKIG